MTNLYHRVLSISNLNLEARQFITRASSLIFLYGFAVMLTNTFLILHALRFVSIPEMSLILAVQFAIQALVSYPSGAIGDWIGQRWMLFVAAMSYGIGFILLSQAFDFITVLIPFSFVALALSLESGTFISWFDNNYKLYAKEDRDRRTYSQFYGKFTMFNEILVALSFILGGLFLVFIGTQVMFLIQGVLLLLVSFLLLRFLQDHKDLKRGNISFRTYFRYLRGGVATVAQNRTLRTMIIGLMISGAGWAIWGGLILFPFYASYATTDALTALLRASIFILGAIGVGIAGILSKRIRKLKRWLAFAVLLTDLVFFMGVYTIIETNPAQSTFVLTSIVMMAITFVISFSPRYLADVLMPRFYLDVIPNENRNAVYSLIPSLTMIVSVFALPIGGLLIENLGLETTIIVLAVNGLVGSGITSFAIYRHKTLKEISAESIDVCCPVFPSTVLDTQAIVPLSLPCCWSFDPISEYIWSQLRETALEDGVITNEESIFIDKIILDIRNYGQLLEKALEDGKIDQGEQIALLEAREKIWIGAHNAAASSGELADDSKQILITLINLLGLIDTKSIFDTSDR